MAVAAALLALALPALAIAGTGTRKYNGSFGSTGAGVEFKVHTKDGKAKYLKLFEWHNIPAQCVTTGNPTATTGELDMRIDVKDKKFHATGKLNDGRETVKVHGRLKDHEKKAVGTLRVTGTVIGCPEVDTGVVDWKAHKVK